MSVGCYGAKGERTIYNRFLQALESLGGLSDPQFGFRTARPTITAVKLMADFVENAMYRKGAISNYCAVITLNVQIFLNSANWNPTWRSLATISVLSYLTAIIDSCLTGRRL